ncbi:MAG: hypothetical protein ABJA70_17705, partial [Chryseolinea sp.]
IKRNSQNVKGLNSIVALGSQTLQINRSGTRSNARNAIYYYSGFRSQDATMLQLKMLVSNTSVAAM